MADNNNNNINIPNPTYNQNTIKSVQKVWEEAKRSSEMVLSFAGKFESKMGMARKPNTERDYSSISPETLNLVKKLSEDAENAFNRTLINSAGISGIVKNTIGISGLGTSNHYRVFTEEFVKQQTKSMEYAKEYYDTFMTPIKSDVIATSYDLEAAMIDNGIGQSKIGALYQAGYEQRDNMGRLKGSYVSFLGIDDTGEAYDYLKNLGRSFSRPLYTPNDVEKVPLDFISRLGASLGERKEENGIVTWDNIEVNPDGVVKMVDGGGLTEASSENYITRENYQKGLDFLVTIKKQHQQDFKMDDGRMLSGSTKVLIDLTKKAVDGKKTFTLGYNTKGFDIAALRRFIQGDEVAKAYAEKVAHLDFDKIADGIDPYNLLKNLSGQDKIDMAFDYDDFVYEPDNLDEKFSYASGKTSGAGIDLKTGHTERYLKVLSADELANVENIVQKIEDVAQKGAGSLTDEEKDYYRILSQIGKSASSGGIQGTDMSLLADYHYNVEDLSVENMRAGLQAIKTVSVNGNVSSSENNLIKMMKAAQDRNDESGMRMFDNPTTRQMFVSNENLLSKAKKEEIDFEKFFGKEISDILNSKKKPTKLDRKKIYFAKDKKFEGGRGTLEYQMARVEAATGVEKAGVHHDVSEDSGQTFKVMYSAVEIDKNGLPVTYKDSEIREAVNRQKIAYEELGNAIGSAITIDDTNNTQEIVVQGVGNANYLKSNKSIFAIARDGKSVKTSDGYTIQYDNDNNPIEITTDEKGKKVTNVLSTPKAVETNKDFDSPFYTKGFTYRLFNMEVLSDEEKKKIQETIGKTHEGFIGAKNIVRFSLEEQSRGYDSKDPNRTSEIASKVTTYIMTQEEFAENFQSNWKAVKIGGQYTEYGKSVKDRIQEISHNNIIERAKETDPTKLPPELSEELTFEQITSRGRELKKLENASRRIKEGGTKSLGVGMLIREMAEVDGEVSKEKMEEINNQIRDLVKNGNKAAKESIKAINDMILHAKDRISPETMALAGIGKAFFIDEAVNEKNPYEAETSELYKHLTSIWEINPNQTNVEYVETSMVLSETVNPNSIAVKGLGKIALSGESKNIREEASKRLVSRLFLDSSLESNKPIEAVGKGLGKAIEAAGITDKLVTTDTSFYLDVSPFLTPLDFKALHPEERLWGFDLNNPYTLKGRILGAFVHSKKTDEQKYAQFFQTMSKALRSDRDLFSTDDLTPSQTQMVKAGVFTQDFYDSLDKFWFTKKEYQTFDNDLNKEIRHIKEGLQKQAEKEINARMPEEKKALKAKMENEVKRLNKEAIKAEEEYKNITGENNKKSASERREIDKKLRNKNITPEERAKLEKEQRDIFNKYNRLNHQAKLKVINANMAFQEALDKWKNPWLSNDEIQTKITQRYEELLESHKNEIDEKNQIIAQKKQVYEEAERYFRETYGSPYEEERKSREFRRYKDRREKQLESEKKEAINAAGGDSNKIIKIEEEFEDKKQKIGSEFTSRKIKHEYRKELKSIEKELRLVDDSRLSVEGRTKIFHSVLQRLRNAHEKYGHRTVGLPTQQVSVLVKAGIFTKLPEEYKEINLEEAVKTSLDAGKQADNISKKEGFQKRLQTIVTGGDRVKKAYETANANLPEYRVRERMALFNEHVSALEQYANKVTGMLDYAGATVQIDDKDHVLASLDGKTYDITKYIPKLDSSDNALFYDINGTMYSARMEGMFDERGQLRVGSFVRNISRKLWSDEKKIEEVWKETLTTDVSKGDAMMKTLGRALSELREFSEFSGGMGSIDKSIVSNNTIEIQHTLLSAYGKKKLQERMTSFSEKQIEGFEWTESFKTLRKFLADQGTEKDSPEKTFIPNEVLKSFIHLISNAKIDGKALFNTDYLLSGVEMSARTSTSDGEFALSTTNILWNKNEFSNQPLNPQRFMTRGFDYLTEEIRKRQKKYYKGDTSLDIVDNNTRIISGTMENEFSNGRIQSSFAIRNMKMSEDSKLQMFDFLVEKAEEEADKLLNEKEIDKKGKNELVQLQIKKIKSLISALNIHEGGGFITGRYVDTIGRVEGTKFILANKDFTNEKQREALKIGVEGIDILSADGKSIIGKKFKLSYGEGYFQKAGERVADIHSDFKNSDTDGKILRQGSIVKAVLTNKIGEGIVVSEDQATREIYEYVKSLGKTIKTEEDFLRYARELYSEKVEAVPLASNQPVKILDAVSQERHEVATGISSFSRMQFFSRGVTDSDKLDETILKEINESGFFRQFKESRGVDLSNDNLTAETFETVVNAIFKGDMDSPIFKTWDDEKDKSLVKERNDLYEKIQALIENASDEDKKRYAGDKVLETMQGYRYYLDSLLDKYSEEISGKKGRVADIVIQTSMKDTITHHKNVNDALNRAYVNLIDQMKMADTPYSDSDAREAAANILRGLFPGADENNMFVNKDGNLVIDKSLTKMNIRDFANIIANSGEFGKKAIDVMFGNRDGVETMSISFTNTDPYTKKPNMSGRDLHQLSSLVFDNESLAKIAERMDSDEFLKDYGKVIKTDANGKFVGVKDEYQGQSVFKEYIDSLVQNYYKKEKSAGGTILPNSGVTIYDKDGNQANAKIGEGKNAKELVGVSEETNTRLNGYSRYTKDASESYQIISSAIQANEKVNDTDYRSAVARKYGYKEVRPGELLTDFRAVPKDSDMSALNAEGSLYNQNYIFNLQDDKYGLTEKFFADNGIDSTKVFVPKGVLEIDQDNINPASEFLKSAKSIAEDYRILNDPEKELDEGQVAKIRGRIVKNVQDLQKNMNRDLFAKDGFSSQFKKVYPENAGRMRATVFNAKHLAEGRDVTGVGDLLYGDTGKTIGELYDNTNGQGKAVSFMRVNSNDLKNFGIDDDYIKNWAESQGIENVDIAEAREQWLEVARTKGVEVLAGRQPDDYLQSIAALRLYVSDDVQQGMYQVDAITAVLMKLDSDGDNIAMMISNGGLKYQASEIDKDGNTVYKTKSLLVDSSNREEIIKRLNEAKNITSEERKRVLDFINMQAETFKRAQNAHTYSRATNDSEIWKKGTTGAANGWTYKQIAGKTVAVVNPTPDEFEAEKARNIEEFQGLGDEDGYITAYEGHAMVSEKDYQALRQGENTFIDIMDASGNEQLRAEWNAATKLKDNFDNETALMERILNPTGDDVQAFGKINISDEQREILQNSIAIQKKASNALMVASSRVTREGAGQIDNPFQAIDSLLSIVAMSNKKDPNSIPFYLAQEQSDAIKFVKESAKEGFLTPKKASGTLTDEDRQMAKRAKDYLDAVLHAAGTDEAEKAEADLADFLIKHGKNMADRYNIPDGLDVTGITDSSEIKQKAFEYRIRQGVHEISGLFEKVSPEYRGSMEILKRATDMRNAGIAPIVDSSTIEVFGNELLAPQDSRITPLFVSKNNMIQQAKNVPPVTTNSQNPSLLSPTALRNLLNGSGGSGIKFSSSLKGAGIVLGALSVLGAIEGNPANETKNEEAQQQVAYPRMNGVPPQNSQAMPQFLSSNLNTMRQGPNRGYIINVDARSDYDNEYTSNLISAAVQNHYDNTHVNIAMNINQQRNDMSSNDIMNYLQTSL